ncbi:MAG TPA: HAD family phosphatase [Syntrophales bacterium]|nr:HAD family phosphatase [Syntrophales bacterium]
MEGTCREDCGIEVVLFDFGGVLAEEGFKNGLQSIARLNNLDEEGFVRTANSAIHACGYVLGKAPESAYWELLRETAGIRGDDLLLRNEILSRFILREWMLDVVKKLRDAHVRLGILSDQTNWLDELNTRYDFFKWFDYVFNSYHMGKSKKDPTHFEDIVHMLGIEAQKILFIDDNLGNCERAAQKGLKVIHYIGRDRFMEEIGKYFPAMVEVL